MPNKYANKSSMEDDFQWSETRPPSLITASYLGNINEAKAAVKLNPFATDEMNQHRMNALAVSIVSLHENISNYILDETEISVIDIDRSGRDNLDLALLYASDDLCARIELKWHEQKNKRLFGQNHPSPTPQ